MSLALQEVLSSLAPVVLVLAAFFVGPGLALGFLILRKRRRKAQLRSPIGIDLLRSPGHSLREQIDEGTNDLTFELLAVTAIPVLVLAVYLLQSQAQTRPITHLAPVYVVGVLALIVHSTWKMWRCAERLDRLRAGYDAEVAVGQTLDQLMRQGAAVFHDVPGEGFNIDHVVVARQGVFAVETK